MKYVLTLVVICSTLIGLKAQTVVAWREATLTGSSTYALAGKAFVEELSDGTFRFRLNDSYLTDAGPDVQIFLSNNSNFTSPIDTTKTKMVVNIGSSFGGISHFSGSYSKSLGTSISSIDSYNEIVFVCVQYGRLYWGHGTLGAKITTTSSANIIENNLQIFPNPTKGLLNIIHNGAESIQLFSSTGVFVKQLLLLKTNDLSTLPKGLYYLRIQYYNKTVNKTITLY